ncbi:MAG: MerR family transcriptional regulator [Candidatus Zixiibacteriota bacterium]
MRNKDYYTTTEAARLLSVSPDTVLKWVKAGKLKSYRTFGGHFRIPQKAIEQPRDKSTAVSEFVEQPTTHQFCWEYLAQGQEVQPECRECITYRSRSKRCYELRHLPEGLGCLRVYCKSDCTDCDYYHMVKEQGLNIIMLSDSGPFIKDAESINDHEGYEIKFARSEYDCAFLIEKFRPDYIVIDCSYGKKRTGAICTNLFNDPRIPVPRIILASKTKKLTEYCDKEVFGWIRKPFTFQQLEDCILGAV